MSKARTLAIGVALNLLRTLWLVMIPALLAGATLRYLVPPSSELRLEAPVPLAVGLFLLFAALLHYWRFYLPGGIFFAALAPALAARYPRARLSEASAAALFGESAKKRSMRRRLEARLSAEELAELDARLADLRRGLEAADVQHVRSAREAAMKLAAPVFRSNELRQVALLALGLTTAAACAVLLRTNVVQPYRVLSASMLPTLQPGDHVALGKTAYGVRLPWGVEARKAELPRRGDVVVFHAAAGTGSAEPLVKRVIGLPGDRITMQGGYPFINGWKVPNCYAGNYFYTAAGTKSVAGRLSVEFLEDETYLTVHVPSFRQVEPYEVKAGEVFVLGDNRNASIDSRSFNHSLGAGVPFSEIVGRADRLFLHTTRDKRVDFRSVLQPLAKLDLYLDGIDTGALRAGIARCLANRPANTSPPLESIPLPGDVARR
jgi:signal peptidase I